MQFSDFPLTYFINPGERLFWGYLLSAAVIALVVTGWRLRGVYRFNKDYWLHRSALLDYQYFFVIWFFKVYLIAPLLLSAREVAIATHRLLRDYITPMFDVPYETVAITYTVALFVASDFTRYWLHRALHAFDFLWAFHKVHHSAEVLNPLTFYRIHPVESLLFGLRYALTAGVVTGVFMTLFAAKLSLLQIFGVNAFIFIFSLLGSNLRHSAIYWGFPRWLETLIISPAQHQLHHQYRYSRYNYGGALAIWDALFGSLKKSRDATKTTRFGIATDEMANYNSLIKLLTSPFRELVQKYKVYFRHWR